MCTFVGAHENTESSHLRVVMRGVLPPSAVGSKTCVLCVCVCVA